MLAIETIKQIIERNWTSQAAITIEIAITSTQCWQYKLSKHQQLQRQAYRVNNRKKRTKKTTNQRAISITITKTITSNMLWKKIDKPGSNDNNNNNNKQYVVNKVYKPGSNDNNDNNNKQYVVRKNYKPGGNNNMFKITNQAAITICLKLQTRQQ